MTWTGGRLGAARRLLLLAALALLLAPRVARAQASPALLTDFRFHLDAAAIGSPDPRFTWTVDFGGAVDLVDYGRGRLSFEANYEAVLGEEFRRFDPIQGNYTLAASSSVRIGAYEVAGIFRHVSRHLSDRPRRAAIDWNTIGARALRGWTFGRLRVDGHAEADRVITRSFVDYQWHVGAGVGLEQPVTPRWTLVVVGDVTLTGMDRDVAGRGPLADLRMESGVRLSGSAARAEFFLALERRVDPFPLEREIRTWALIGLRLVNR